MKSRDTWRIWTGAILGLIFALVVLILAASAFAASSNGRSTLKGSQPSWANSNHLRSATNPSDTVDFHVYLPLRNQSAAEALANAVSDPKNSSYGHYLTPKQVANLYAPTAAQVSAVSSWLQSQGFSVGYVPSNNQFVTASGTAAQVESAFGVQLNQYSVNGVTVRGPSSDLSVPSTIAADVAGVIGIDESFALAAPAAESAAPPESGFRNAPPCSTYWNQYNTANTVFSDPSLGINNVTLPLFQGSTLPVVPCGYAGSQLQNAYGVGSAIASGVNGTGSTVAIIDAYASPTIVSDANTYFSRHGLPTFSPGQFTQMVAPGTYNRPNNSQQNPSSWYGEETLDVEARSHHGTGSEHCLHWHT